MLVCFCLIPMSMFLKNILGFYKDGVYFERICYVFIRMLFVTTTSGTLSAHDC